jgi:ABC-type nickel/cobalt efflux system permease component RcnA
VADDFFLLCGTALSIGAVHTLLGPDHYLPFAAMAQAGRWTLRRTIIVTVLCGVGHVLSSVVLGAVGIGLGIAVFKLEAMEAARAGLAGWLLLAFGLAYLVYGIRRAIRHRPHTHWHAHADGTVHSHEHVHVDAHAHVHARDEGTAGGVTPWVLFTILVFGPCEPLIPILMYPAAQGNAAEVAIVTALFAAATLTTMTAAVVCAYAVSRPLSQVQWARYGPAVAGFVVVLCGTAIKVGL